MANHSSTKKSIRKTIERTKRNKSRASMIKTCTKKVMAEISVGSKESAQHALEAAQSQIMKGVSKGIMKLNTASRKIGRLSKKIKSLTPQ